MNKIAGSLKRVMTFNFIVAAAVPILVISVITITLLSRSMGEQVIKYNTQMANDLVKGTEDFLAMADAVIRQAATTLAAGGFDNRQIQYYLDTLVASHPYLDAVHVVDEDGHSVFVSPFDPSYTTLDLSRQPFFQETKRTAQVHWSTTFISQHTGQPTLTITRPTGSGMVVGYINLSKLNELAAKGDGNQHSWAAILDTEGTFIGHSDREQVYQRNIGDREFITTALAGKARTMSFRQGRDNYLITVDVVTPTGWPVLVAQRTDIAFAPVNNTRNIFIAGSLLALGLAVVIAMGNLKRILLPLDVFTRKTLQVASGNYNLPLERYEFTEINTISEHFQSMAEAVRLREDELRRQQLELANYMRTLERSNRELDQFAYVVSHDLKAPLRAIANLSQWLEEDLEGSLEAEARHKLELLQGRVQRMENLIAGILEYSRIGRIKAAAEPVKVGNLIAEVLEDLAPVGGLRVQFDTEMPEIITARVRLKQVFANLIGNAVRHHNKPDGHIWITVSDLGSWLEFSVADNGPGIAADYHHKIFEIFQTLQPRDTLESTGVGLALVKKIVEGQGGSVRIISAEGQGANFIFTWPKAVKEE
ncbi:sensor histidine kinase [Sporomusa termitida]|uniref:histidine kinase n=1 Tax=Sporomusa termitida TaxID=2377 RepID=A0A517E136_9FIRM|nr:ATP-binding protein [Sporomusa termitida]QDR83313.1 Adaptive-response sensory-kinase SasA [Sporomusa termitida]